MPTILPTLLLAPLLGASELRCFAFVPWPAAVSSLYSQGGARLSSLRSMWVLLVRAGQ